MNKSIYAECFVEGNKIVLPQSLNQAELLGAYNILTDDLLTYNIPHYRIIGFRIFDAYTDSVVHVNRAIGYSTIELAEIFRKIIPTKLGGDKFGSESESISGYSILKKDHTSIGQLQYNPINIRIPSPELFCSKNLFFYNRDGWVEPTESNLPNFLIEDVFICKFKNTESNTATSALFYKKGTGIQDFEENAAFFTNDSGVFPCRTRFDLSEYFIVKYPNGNSGNTLELYYREKINESNLTKILREYGRLAY